MAVCVCASGPMDMQRKKKKKKQGSAANRKRRDEIYSGVTWKRKPETFFLPAAERQEVLSSSVK